QEELAEAMVDGGAVGPIGIGGDLVDDDVVVARLEQLADEGGGALDAVGAEEHVAELAAVVAEDEGAAAAGGVRGGAGEDAARMIGVLLAEHDFAGAAAEQLEVGVVVDAGVEEKERG